MSRGQSGQILIILVATLLLGGGGLAAGVVLTGKPVATLKKEALAMVEDQSRREKIEAVFKRWDKDAERIDASREKNRKTMLGLIQRRDANPADFDRIYAESDAIEAKALDVGLDTRFALREQLSESEWRRLFAPPQR